MPTTFPARKLALLCLFGVLLGFVQSRAANNESGGIAAVTYN